MSERDEFEAWKRSINPTILFLRHDHNGSNLMGQYASMIIEDQWQAWQAARATPQQAVPVAWLHEIFEPTGQHLSLYSASSANPWSHWMGSYRDECRYKATPLYAIPPSPEPKEPR